MCIGVRCHQIRPIRSCRAVFVSNFAFSWQILFFFLRNLLCTSQDIIKGFSSRLSLFHFSIVARGRIALRRIRKTTFYIVQNYIHSVRSKFLVFNFSILMFIDCLSPPKTYLMLQISTIFRFLYFNLWNFQQKTVDYSPSIKKKHFLEVLFCNLHISHTAYNYL